MLYGKGITVLILLAGAVYTDIKQKKIKNLWMVIGLLWGILFSLLEGGTGQLIEGLKMGGKVLIALFFLYLLKGLGAGDIKLLAVLAVFFPAYGMWLPVVSFVMGGILVLLRMGYRILCSVPVYQKGETIHFSVPIALGTLAMMGGMLWAS